MNLSKKFIFNDEYSKYDVNNPYYIISITVEEIKYDNDINSYYSITYKYDYMNSPEMSNFENYMYKTNFDNIDENHNSDIIYKNPLTEKLIQYLLMGDNELKRLTGDITPQKYRLNIIKVLSLF